METVSLAPTLELDRTSVDAMIACLYRELEQLAERLLSRERRNHTLEPAGLVNELYLKLLDQRKLAWQDRKHFVAIAARAMRRILVDHAARRNTAKRGAHRKTVPLDEVLSWLTIPNHDPLELDELLADLARVDPPLAQIVELRYFAGLTMEDVARVMGTAKRTLEREWTLARAWLRSRMAHARVA